MSAKNVRTGRRPRENSPPRYPNVGVHDVNTPYWIVHRVEGSDCVPPLKPPLRVPWLQDRYTVHHGATPVGIHVAQRAVHRVGVAVPALAGRRLRHDGSGLRNRASSGSYTRPPMCTNQKGE